jgi:uncharacterized cupin superfamily protein
MLMRDRMKGAPMTPAPINSTWIEGGDPQAKLAILAHSDDCATSTILWECSAGRFTWRYSFDETIHFLDGGVRIRIADGAWKTYGAGDTIHFSRGAVATWEIDTFIRKLAFCRKAPPRLFISARRFARTAYHRMRGRTDALTAAPVFG